VGPVPDPLLFSRLIKIIIIIIIIIICMNDWKAIEQERRLYEFCSKVLFALEGAS
jgi:hypothetical protein